MSVRDGDGAVLERAEGKAWATAWAAGPATPSIIPGLAFGLDEPQPAKPSPKPPTSPEIDCVRHLVPPGLAALAERRAGEADVGADRVLIAWNVISEETYAASLSDYYGIPFEPLIGRPRSLCPLSDERMIESARTGLLLLRDDDGDVFVVAPRLIDSRKLVELAASGGTFPDHMRITSAARLQDFVRRHAAQTLAHVAAEELRESRPEFSAGAGRLRLGAAAACIAAAAMAAAAMLAPQATFRIAEVALGAIFVAWTGLRLLGLLTTGFLRRKRRAWLDHELPVYTIIIALLREGRAVEGLVQSLRDLDYPPERLDIKFVLEPDDAETRDALAALRPGAPFEIIVAPEAGPRTKPKALNAALPFARGKFVAVYDAEDRPEPDQLRKALEAFVTDNDRLACVQARLTIDNATDTWLTRLFTAEYAGLFDVFLPGLAHWRLPLPLGGSSNHFRTDVLRELGAWDPYNVTEDADLGMRLARAGYRTAVIASTTYEEAPAKFGPWLRQRTRWFKGWVQTWLVHMRHPLRLMDELGLAGFTVFQLVVGGTVLAALIHALFAAHLMAGLMMGPPEDSAAQTLLGLYAALVFSGYAVSVALAIAGLARRRLLNCAGALVFTPVYWLLLSIAAWRALYQLLRDPYRWEKTEHRLARNALSVRRDQR